MTGGILADASGAISVTLTNGTNFSSWTDAGVSLSLDASSRWNVLYSSAIETLSDAAGISGSRVTNIIGNGNNVTYDAASNPSLGGAHLWARERRITVAGYGVQPLHSFYSVSTLPWPRSSASPFSLARWMSSSALCRRSRIALSESDLSSGPVAVFDPSTLMMMRGAVLANVGLAAVYVFRERVPSLPA